jgi:aspartate aminotransferase-like enzyme
MSQPIIHHRTPQFEAIVREVQEGLKYLFQTEKDVLVLASSGTGAMESAITTLFSPGDHALVVNGGKFGERWVNLCKAYGLPATVITVEWGKAVDPAAVKAALDADPAIKGVFVQASETSTCAAHPVRELAALVAPRPETILVVDAITALGVFDLPMDRWGIDVVITGSQKALMLPPGLAMIALSDKAWGFAEKSTMPKFYFDLKRERKNLAASTTAWTPAISLIIGLREALAMLREEGLEAVFARHARLAKATRAAATALGLALLAPDSPSDAVTGIFVPEGINGGALNKRLRDGYGVTMAGGQDHLKGKIMRVAHLGYVDTFDVIVAVAALELALAEMGHPVPLGAGVKAAQQVFLELGV